MSQREHQIEPAGPGDRANQWREDMGRAQADREVDELQQGGKPRPSRWRMPVFGVALVAFTAVLGWNLQPLFRTVPPLPPTQQEASLDVMTYFLVLRIEAYRDAHGEPPPDLDALGLPMTGFEYTRLGQRYELTASAGRTRISYSSSTPPSTLLQRRPGTATEDATPGGRP